MARSFASELFLAATVTAAISLVACAPERGTERGDCYPNSTCNAGLSCRSDRCVRLEADAAADDVVTNDVVPASDAASDSPVTAMDVWTAPVDPTFTRDMVPFFQRSCGTTNVECHSRAVFNANRDFGCRGWLTLENATLGAAYNSGPMAGQSTGCPDRTLYERLVGAACQECSGSNPRLVAPGDPTNSYLFRKINGGPYCPFPFSTSPSSPMPMVGTLTPAEIDMVRRWIANGAPQ